MKYHFMWSSIARFLHQSVRRTSHSCFRGRIIHELDMGNRTSNSQPSRGFVSAGGPNPWTSPAWPITKWEAQLVPRLKREGSMTAKRLSAGCTSRKIWQIPYLFDMQMYLQLHLDANQGYSNVFVVFHQVCQNKILGTFGHTCEFNFHSDGPL